MNVFSHLWSLVASVRRQSTTNQAAKPQPHRSPSTLRRRMLSVERLEPRCMLTGNPVVSVTDHAWNPIPDDSGAFNFGSASYSGAMDRRFHVRNLGEAALTLTPIDSASLGANYTLVQNFAATVLGPNDSTEFIIRYSPSGIGGSSGGVAFATNAPASPQFNFVLDGSGVNHAPTCSGFGPVVMQEDGLNYVLDLSGPFSDMDQSDDTLTYAVVSNSNPNLFDSTSVAGRFLTLDPRANAHGSANIVLSATDAQGAAVQSTMTVQVYAVDDPPIVTSFAYSLGETSMTLYGTVSDPDTSWQNLQVYFNGLAMCHSAYVNPDFTFVKVIEMPSWSGMIGAKARTLPTGPESPNWMYVAYDG